MKIIFHLIQKKINNIKEFLISPEDLKKTFNIGKQIFRFNRKSFLCYF